MHFLNNIQTHCYMCLLLQRYAFVFIYYRILKKKTYSFLIALLSIRNCADSIA